MSRRSNHRFARIALIAACALAAFAAGAMAVNVTTPGQSAAKKKRGKATASFQIRTQVPGQLAPGRSIPLQISLANNRPVPLWIKRMTVRIAVDPAHTAAGCTVGRDYRITQIPKQFFPYKLAKGKKARKGKRPPKPKWHKLSTKRRGSDPSLSMVALTSVNQDACKGATLTISYKTQATTKKPKKRAKK